MKPFKKAVLHVGPPKSGSTAIQSTFNRNRDFLYNNGVYYPSGVSHPLLGSYFSNLPEYYSYNFGQSSNVEEIKLRDSCYMKHLRSELEEKSGALLVLSYEGFVTLDIEALELLKMFMSEYADHCEVVFYARAPLSFATSAMSQCVKMGYLAWADSSRLITPFIDYLDNINFVFDKGRLIVRKYCKSTFPDGNILRDFFFTIGFPASLCNIDALFRNTDSNMSLSYEAMLVGENIINKLSNQISRIDFVKLYTPVISRIEGNKIRLSGDQASEILSKSSAHSKYLQTKYNISFNEDYNMLIGENSVDETVIKSNIDELADNIINLVQPTIIYPLTFANDISDTSKSCCM
ncbi:MAG: hypothetical protein ACOYL3_23725 [Desulfuromonadaceae bacterium]